MKLFKLAIILSIFVFLISKDIQSQPAEPFQPDENTVGLWHMDSQAPDSLWSVVIGEEGERFLFGATVQSQDNTFLVAGTTERQGDAGDVFLFEINGDGEMLWTRYFGGEGEDRCNDILQLENGNLVLLCSSDSFVEDAGC